MRQCLIHAVTTLTELIHLDYLALEVRVMSESAGRFLVG